MNLKYCRKTIFALLLFLHGEFLFSKSIQKDVSLHQNNPSHKKCSSCPSDRPKIENKKTSLELGAGLLSFKIPHYRGSDQKKDYFLPLPFFIYSSKNIEAEPSFIRGTFFRKGPFALKLSVLAGLSVESETNTARHGMPNLGFTVEVGPMILARLWTSKDKKYFVNLEFPFRYVMEIDSSPKSVGLFSIPYINLVNLPKKETWNWGIELSFAVHFADQNYHDHYYSVGPDYVRAGRPQYSARGGYNGSSWVLILNRRFKNLYLVPFVRYDSIKSAVFEDSPLVREKDYLAFGLGSFWLF